MRRLFEGGVTNVKTLAAGGDYSRAATIRGRRLIDEIRYILLQYWEGNRGKYTVQDRPYWPDQREAGYRGREQPPYCPTVGIAIINLLYNFCIAIGTGNNERAIWENFAL